VSSIRRNVAPWWLWLLLAASALLFVLSASIGQLSKDGRFTMQLVGGGGVITASFINLLRGVRS
jgi:anti-sigma factor RsiW